jgi:uncharacterized membrane protein (UPF0127 family)
MCGIIDGSVSFGRGCAKVLVNRTTGEVLAGQVVLCDRFWSRLRGLMFRRALASGEAYVFVSRRESVAEASIHMFFVFFPISVLWLDGQRRVVDSSLAKPFHPYYAPRKAALYTVEAGPELLCHSDGSRVRVGDQLDF